MFSRLLFRPMLLLYALRRAAWRLWRFTRIEEFPGRAFLFTRSLRTARFVGVSLPLSALFFAVVAFAWSAHWSAPEVSYERSPEVGEEVVVRFRETVTEVEARARFRIDPPVAGDLVWLDESRELHFIPHHGFNPLARYRVGVSRWSSLSAALRAPVRTFVFTTPAGEAAGSVSLPENVSTGKFIDLNLSTMIATLFEDGKPVASYPIAGKGNPWTTPTREGNFRVLSKHDLHFSSIYKVWMPYSIRYSGGFYLHGWPYWPNGRRLTSVYSGGCMRFYDEDIKKIYDWADVGTPVSVHSTPGRAPLFSEEAIQDGDLVREESGVDVFIVKRVGAKRFKRHVMTPEFEQWYAHLKPFWRRVKIVPDGTLVPYRLSRWVYAADDPLAPANRTIYEINSPGRKHAMRCGDYPGDPNVAPEKCDRSWVAYGWDRDELFIVSSRELNAYETGEPIALPPAPQRIP